MNGKRARMLRRRKGLTQVQLEAISGIDQTYISAIENDHPEHVGAPIIAKLATSLETSADYLLGLTDDPSPPDSKVVGPPPVQRLAQLYLALDEEAQRHLLHQAELLSRSHGR